MIKRLFKKVFGKSRKAAKASKAHVIPFQQHKVAREGISYASRRVTDGLQAAGFQAYVVGGAVRDLLLDRHPKDFDVATDATPEEVKRVFRRARIIGRRFRLVHVMFGDETVEVSTFRRAIEAEDAETDAHGRILRDNEFGDQEQDAARRDFTANGLFYDPSSQEIFDYHNGYADIRANTLRMIGDPEVRYREDPVRMLRAVRLSAKLGMKLDSATAAPIAKMKELLSNVPEARLFDEMLKLLLSGHALACIKKLRSMHLHHGMLPMLDVILEQPMGEKFVMAALQNTDQRIADEKPTSPAFLFAALLWHEVLTVWNAKQAAGEKPIGALHLAMEEVLDRQRAKLAIPRRYDTVMKEIWLLQPRFEQRGGQRPFRLLALPRFRAAYDFLLLRCESGEADKELGKWWEEFQHTNEDRRAEMLLADTAGPKKRRKRSRKPKSAGQAELPID
ncbi:MAG: polynucleotide adenylyltransferase PcnB [Gammaproteobacteria bacterium]|nr:polynucleotide adenylyltransferase PcnB [Gammaproteobacteria bacterium]MBU1623951.1 polynucleotide adenylyltransferase PcnB [Gammaproteobacteria bacterium]MBU1982168.1 polynucleotide adenylyltransferase PcnB [Gammaproteobacteria bacterium]